MSVPDRGGAVAERQSGGFGGRFWRHGIADGIRAAGIGNIAFQSDHARSGGFHDHVPHVGDLGDTRSCLVGKRFGAAKGSSEVCSGSVGASKDGHASDSGGAPRQDRASDFGFAGRAGASAGEQEVTLGLAVRSLKSSVPVS
jgi:hypothetical protein